MIIEETIDHLNELREKHDYYSSGLNGWKRAVIDYLPHGSSLSLQMKVQEFLDTISRIE